LKDDCVLCVYDITFIFFTVLGGWSSAYICRWSCYRQGTQQMATSGKKVM
jgi:hypothetical protein